MVSRVLEGDIQRGYTDIQDQVDAEVAKNTSLLKDRLALIEKVRALEAKVAEAEEQRRASQSEVEALRTTNSVLEAEVTAERSLSALVSQATWKAMECMEGAISELGGVPPPRSHTVDQLDSTLNRLHRAGEVFLPAARAYGNYCAKTGWTAALVSLRRAGCPHVDALGAGALPVAPVADITAGHVLVRRANNVLAREFWSPHGRSVTMEALRLSVAQKTKGKGQADGGGAAERGDDAGGQV